MRYLPDAVLSYAFNAAILKDDKAALNALQTLGGSAQLALWGAAGDAENGPTLIPKLIAEGADPNFKGSDGITPLMFAILYGNVEIVKSLLNAGADPLLKDDAGRTAEEHLKNPDSPRSKPIKAALLRTADEQRFKNEKRISQIESTLEALVKDVAALRAGSQGAAPKSTP